MKKLLTAALAVLGVTCCFAAEEAKPELVDVRPEKGRVSVKLGYFQPIGWNEEFDFEGVAIEGELLLRLANNFAIGFRGTVGGASEEIEVLSENSKYHWRTGTCDYNYYDYNGTVQAYVSLFRDENVDIYLTGGMYYDAIDMELEYFGDRRHGYTYSDDDSTIGFLGGIGLELKNEYIGLKLEADYLSKPDYDKYSKCEEEDKSLVQLFGSLMFFVGDRVAFDFSGRYFTEWEDLYAMFGLTVLF